MRTKCYFGDMDLLWDLVCWHLVLIEDVCGPAYCALGIKSLIKSEWGLSVRGAESESKSQSLMLFG